ncbi:LOW QUALITY PROTEIN: hypothetical protein PanWU01x14_183000 [Parasponia andersonii]|uniref:Uncharacterized protein n=1 Tax=Parasponia andersonii TaxID=3476 RepID=A0A2P5C5K8_PARAD|nr:LOW QUALITY PROTEIN: hypothetical protein PanWU01x14_183000 [Parasponia andersonii]
MLHKPIEYCIYIYQTYINNKIQLWIALMIIKKVKLL